MADTIFRSALNGCFRAISTPYGQYLAPARDPLADGDLPEEALKSFELHEHPPVIPAELWSAWIKLCFHFVKNDNAVEVGARIMRHVSDESQWRFLIPQQLVCGGSVQVASTDGAMDLISGEVVATYPPEDWVSFGSTHSHNTMGSFFSSVDDSTELGDPGLHIVVGDIDIDKMQYTMKASITAHQKRYIIDHCKVVDATPQTTDFHPDVLKNVGHVPLRQHWAPASKSSWPLKRQPSRTWSEADQAWMDRALEFDSADFRWINDKFLERELVDDQTADMVLMHQNINELYEKLMHIQDRKCRTPDQLAQLYYELEAVIESMEHVIEMDKQEATCG